MIDVLRDGRRLAGERALRVVLSRIADDGDDPRTFETQYSQID